MYDADGNVMSYFSERVDKRGRAVELIISIMVVWCFISATAMTRRAMAMMVLR